MAKFGEDSGSFGGGGISGGASFGTSATLGKAFSSAGAAVSDLFAAEGLEISADGYRRAAGFSKQNLGYVQESNKIKMLQTDRAIFQALGGQENDIGAAGLAASGSALDVMRDSAAQAELTRHLVETQGKIDETTLKQQIDAYETSAENADNAAEGKMWSAGINAVSAVVSAGSFFRGG